MPLNALIPTIAAAVEPTEGGGASTRDVLILGLGINAVILLWVWLIGSYRSGGATWLRRIAGKADSITGLPGWAVLPGLGAILGALVALFGATWDIGLHIDIGRDDGPLGTLAHWPMLLGLEWIFLMGVLAIVMSPTDRDEQSPASMTVLGWTAPAGAILLMAGGAFSLLGFPLDDLWHRTFGQDVTLWGPTHTMFIGGIAAAGSGALLLMVEGARVRNINPFTGAFSYYLPIGSVLAGLFLYLTTAVLHEFNWGVPQYRAVWMPYFLALGGAFAMVLAYQLNGRLGPLRALLVWLPVQVLIMLFVGQVTGTTPPAMPLFIAQTAIVTALGWRGRWQSPLRFALVAGALCGVGGFAADYAWTHAAYPLPWQQGLIVEGLLTSILVAIAGALLGALMAGALRNELALFGRPLAVALASAAVILGLAINNVQVTVPDGLTAAISVENVRQQPIGHRGEMSTVGDVTVRLSDPSLARDGNWAYVLAWQGRGRAIAKLVEQADGTLRSAGPVPLSGNWKSFVRIHKGYAEVAAPIRMAADPAINFRGYAAPVNGAETRAMIRDTTLLQIERKPDGPYWAWKPAFLLVIGFDLLLFVFMGAICVRVGRSMPNGTPTAAADTKPLASSATPSLA